MEVVADAEPFLHVGITLSSFFSSDVLTQGGLVWDVAFSFSGVQGCLQQFKGRTTDVVQLFYLEGISLVR